MKRRQKKQEYRRNAARSESSSNPPEEFGEILENPEQDSSSLKKPIQSLPTKGVDSVAQLDLLAPTIESIDYKFPSEKLKVQQQQDDKTPIVLIAFGSFSPITNQHLRMFELAADFIRLHTSFELMGAYLSPVSDAYHKADLASCHDRIEMCLKAVETTPWIMVDTFEATKKNEKGEADYLPTAKVMEHFDYQINQVLGGVQDLDGNMKKVKIALLAGADLILSMGKPELWPSADLDIILGTHGAFGIERFGTSADDAVQQLEKYKQNIKFIKQPIMNDISSTKIRQLLRESPEAEHEISYP